MTWTGDKWPGPYGQGSYGPDWTAIEEQELAPFHAACGRRSTDEQIPRSGEDIQQLPMDADG